MRTTLTAGPSNKAPYRCFVGLTLNFIPYHNSYQKQSKKGDYYPYASGAGHNDQIRKCAVIKDTFPRRV